MIESRVTSLARLRLILLRYGIAKGLDRAEALQRAGLSEEDLGNPDARLPVDSSFRLWKMVIDLEPGRAVGIRLAQSVSIRDYGLVGYAMSFSRDLRSALQRLVRYGHIVSDELEISLKEIPPHVEITCQITNPSLDALRHPVDLRLAALVQAAREITKTHIVPEEVWFPYPRPDNLDEHRAFFESRLEFGKKLPMVILNRSDLDLPIPDADETLSRYLDHQASDTLESLVHEGSLRDQLYRVLLQQLSGGEPTLERTAKALGLGARTIQRRLKEEGTSFFEVLDGLRSRMAVLLLQDPDHSIGDVSFFLGYSDPSAFNRAFRRWTGEPPERYRRSRSRKSGTVSSG